MTAGQWNVACDSYGKVQHSRKACVYASLSDGIKGDRLVTVAGRIEDWEDARLMAAAPQLLTALKHLVDIIREAPDPATLAGRLNSGALDNAHKALVAAEWR